MGTSKNSEQATLWDSPAVISSVAARSGISPSTSPDGEMKKSGPEAAPVPLSPQQVKEQGLQTQGTCGRHGSLSLRCRPPIVFAEQVSSKLALSWFDLVKSDLNSIGYAVMGADLSAACVGAPHIRGKTLYLLGERQ